MGWCHDSLIPSCGGKWAGVMTTAGHTGKVSSGFQHIENWYTKLGDQARFRAPYAAGPVPYAFSTLAQELQVPTM